MKFETEADSDAYIGKLLAIVNQAKRVVWLEDVSMTYRYARMSEMRKLKGQISEWEFLHG